MLQSQAAERCPKQGLPMAPLDPALTVAQQRMNTQAGAKRRRGPAAKQAGSAPKQRCATQSGMLQSAHAAHKMRTVALTIVITKELTLPS